MAYYVDEHDIWKCPRHPSKRRRSGVCPSCLKDRLSVLCPECASVRHSCSCSASVSSSSSSFSDGAPISALIAGEPAFCRSRSAAVYRSSGFPASERKPEVPKSRTKSPSIWSMIWPQKAKREKVESAETMTLRRSRSVAVGNEARSSRETAKGKSWYFPSPMKVFRQAAMVAVRERSPLHRG